MKRMNFTRNNREGVAENAGYMEIQGGETPTEEVELYIYGDIVATNNERWTYEDACPQMIADFMAGIDNNAPMTVHINSGGGDVFAGIAIYNILKRHTGRKRGVVDGLAASIASVILMACDEIEISSGAQVMIHKPSTYAYGNADDLTAMVAELDKCQESITNIYLTRVQDGVTAEKLTELINQETWMSGESAAQVFVVNVTQTAPIKACASSWITDQYKHTPEDLAFCGVQDISDPADREKKEAEAILEDLYLYGT